VVFTVVGCGRFDGERSRVVPALHANEEEGSVTTPSPNRQYDLQMARSILLKLAPIEVDLPTTRRLARATADPIMLRVLAVRPEQKAA
jgi:hypothetical protein